MNRRVLFVDDDQVILDTFRRNLRRIFDVHTAKGAEEALALVRDAGEPFAVVVSDLKMPRVDGIRLLSRMQEVSPDSVRVMLTAHADLDTAIAAVNDGHVFRLLTKPAPLEQLIQTVQAGCEQFRLVISERELLDGTLRGSIQMLCEVLSLVNPEAFGRNERIRHLVESLGRRLGVSGTWEIEVAAMLSQIGFVSLSEEILRKIYVGEELDRDEQRTFAQHPEVAASLLSNIPRMQEVAGIIQRQDQSFQDHPGMPLGARMLKVALDYDALVQGGREKDQALELLRRQAERYDPDVLEVLEPAVYEEEGYCPRPVRVKELETGMVLAREVRTNSGLLLLVRGQQVNDVILMRLESFSASQGIKEPVYIREPITGTTEPEAAAAKD